MSAEDSKKGAEGGTDTTPVTPAPTMTEDEMLKILSTKYHFTPKGLPPPATRPKAKPEPLMSLAATTPPPGFSSPVLHSPGFTYSKLPKIPTFSGDDPVPKSEIGYYEWRHEVSCLRRDSSFTNAQVLQAIRASLRGTARRLLVSLGDSVSIEAVVRKLEVYFGEPAKKGISMREFFNASQRHDESVTAYGCRLEYILDLAFEGGHLPRAGRDELLCERLWSGLRSELLKSNTRHKLDSNPDYNQFMQDVRQVEVELKLSASQSNKSKQLSAQLSSESTDFSKQMADLEQRMKSQMSSLQSGIDKKFAAVLQRLDSLSQPSYSTPPPVVFPTPPPPTFQPNTVSQSLPTQPNQYRGNTNRRSWRGRSNRRWQQNQQQQQTTNPSSTGHPNF